MNQKEILCLWGNRCSFMGYLPDLGLRRQGAAAIYLGLESGMEVSENGDTWQSCRSALIHPMTMHAVRFSGNFCVQLFVDLNSPDYESLRRSNAKQEQADILITLREEEHLISVARQVLEAESDERVFQLLNQFPQVPSPMEARQKDARIIRVMEKIASEPQERHSIKSLADSVGMSVSNLEHLFKKEAGVPLHAFRTWLRLKMTVSSLLEGANLTDAALRAGFFDSAHFSRTFRASFGLPPSSIFNRTRQIRTYVEIPDAIESKKRVNIV